MAYIRRILLTYCLFVFSCASAQKVEVDLNAIKQVVTEWNDAHNAGSKESFNELYANSILFYTRTLTKKECVDRKLSLLQRTLFSQELTSDLQLSVFESGTIYCAFTKSVSEDGTTKEYPSYLLLRRSGNRYLVEGEGDLITDRNLKFHLLLGPQVPKAELEDVPTTGHSDKITISISSKKVTYWIITAVALFGVGIIAFIFIRKPAKSHPKPVIADPKPEVAKPIDPRVNDKAVFTPRPSFASSGHSPTMREAFLEQGKIFEEFVIERFMSKSNVFKWKDATSDRGTRKYYPESNGYPDLQFEFRLPGRIHPFAIECKYRSINRGLISVVKDFQLERYKDFSKNKEMDVYVVLGLGGNPGAPLELYVIPLSVVSPWMEHQDLSKYRTFRKTFYFDPKTLKLY